MNEAILIAKAEALEEAAELILIDHECKEEQDCAAFLSQRAIHYRAQASRQEAAQPVAWDDPLETAANFGSPMKPPAFIYFEKCGRYSRPLYTHSAPAEERAAAVHKNDCPSAWAFFEKYALGSKVCPSCLKCGEQTQPEDRAIQHMELPDIFICKACCAPAEGWQPIETAPRDGTKIVILWGAEVVIGFWLDNTKTSKPWAGWRAPSLTCVPWDAKPTHWQPLPPLPAAPKEQS